MLRFIKNLDLTKFWENKRNVRYIEVQLIVILRLRFIKNLDLTKFWENKRNVRYIEVQLMISCLIVAQEPSKFLFLAHYRHPNVKAQLSELSAITQERH